MWCKGNTLLPTNSLFWPPFFPGENKIKASGIEGDAEETIAEAPQKAEELAKVFPQQKRLCQRICKGPSHIV